MSGHRWEQQVEDDPARHGCRRCGGERHDIGPAGVLPLYRMPADRTWSVHEPTCRPARGTSPGVNPDNARRLLRTLTKHRGAPIELRTGERCPACGYGKTVQESVRETLDILELELVSGGREIVYTPAKPSRRRRQAA